MRACCGGLSPSYDLTDAIMFASNILYRLSGRRYPGLCVETRWPCHNPSCGGGQDPAWLAFHASGWNFNGTVGAVPSVPYRVGDGWANDWDVAGLCGGSCRLHSIRMPSVVSEIVEIVVDREVLPPSAYRVRGNREIARVDGGTWPCSNSLLPPDTFSDPTFEVVIDATGGTWDLVVAVDGAETTIQIPATVSAAALTVALEAVVGSGVIVSGGPGGTDPLLISFDVRSLVALVSLSIGATALTGGAGTATLEIVDPGSMPPEHGWYITYLSGPPPPPDGQMAADIFACQVALSRCGGDNCVLPARLKEISREGVDMAFADPMEFLDRGQVGIYEVDLFLASVNPSKLRRRSTVHRADAPSGPRRFP